MDKFQPGDHVHTTLGITSTPGGMTFFASLKINPGAPLRIIHRLPDVAGKQVYSVDNGYAYEAEWLILTPISVPKPAVAPTAPTPKFKVGDLVYTTMTEKTERWPGFYPADGMGILKENPCSVVRILKNGDFHLDNNFNYIAEWLALADPTEKSKAQSADFLCLQVFADEEYDPDDVMKAVRDMCKGG